MPRQGPAATRTSRTGTGSELPVCCRSVSQFRSELKMPRFRRARPSTSVARGRPPAHSRAYIHTRSMGFALRLRWRRTGCRVRRATTRSATSARPLAHRSGHHPSEVPACLPVHCQICAPQRQRKHDDATAAAHAYVWLPGGPIGAAEVSHLAPTEYHIPTKFDDVLAESSFAASARRQTSSNKGGCMHELPADVWREDDPWQLRTPSYQRARAPHSPVAPTSRVCGRAPLTLHDEGMA
jgi:hypothetical protein